MKHLTHWIDGKPWTGGGASQRGDIYNPATGQVTGTVDFAGAAEVDAAARAAAAAFPGWRETSLVKRSAVMFAFRELVRQHHGELAALISAEHGKVTSDAAGEVARGLEVVEFACGIPHLLKGSFSENEPFSRCGMPQANSTTSRPRATSPAASEVTFPCSALISAASSP